MDFPKFQIIPIFNKVSYAEWRTGNTAKFSKKRVVELKQTLSLRKIYFVVHVFYGYLDSFKSTFASIYSMWSNSYCLRIIYA